MGKNSLLSSIQQCFKAAWYSVGGTNVYAEFCALDFLSAVLSFAVATFILFCQCASFWYSFFLYLLSIYFIRAWKKRLPNALWRYQVQKTLYGVTPSYNRKVLSYSFLSAAILGSILGAINYVSAFPPNESALQPIAVQITTSPYLHTTTRGNNWISFTAKTQEKMIFVQVDKYWSTQDQLNQAAILGIARGDQVILYVDKGEVGRSKVTAWKIQGKSGDILSYSDVVKSHLLHQVGILMFIAIMVLAGIVFYPRGT